MNICKAKTEDISAIVEIYSQIHEEEKRGSCVGWLPDVYPTADTAETALKRQDLFVCEEEGIVLTCFCNYQSLPSGCI